MKRIIAISFVVMSTLCFGQQLPQYSQYLLNDYVINPAIGGSRPYFQGKANYRYQWEGITDAPRTYILSVNGPLKSQKVGLGGYIFTDHVGPTRRTGGAFSYSYHLKLSDKEDKLSFGITAGLLQFMVDGSQITLRDPDDNILTNSVQSVLLPDAGFGLYLYRKNKYQIGFSAPQLIPSKIKFFKEGENPKATLTRHFFFSGAYRFDLTDDIALQPYFFVKYVKPAPVQPELNLKVLYKDRIWVAGGWRYLDAITAMLGVKLTDNITLGYSFDFATSNIRNYSRGTHELMLGMRFYEIKPKDAAPSIQ